MTFIHCFNYLHVPYQCLNILFIWARVYVYGGGQREKGTVVWFMYLPSLEMEADVFLTSQLPDLKTMSGMFSAPKTIFK